MNPASDLVNKLWRLCALLRKDGITYQQYVTELTYLLFLKMASEQKDESRIPEQYRWRAITAANEAEVLQVYRQALVDLGNPDKVSDRSVVAIFQNATTVVREPATLRKLIDVMVDLMQPQPGEVIQDPAAGTGGFLIAADRYMRARTDDYHELLDHSRRVAFQLREAIRGIENVPDTFRLLLMNLHLHKIDPDHLDLGDTLSPKGSEARFKNADLILTNPPFGPAGGPPTRDDLTITDRVSSYQLPFVEHVVRALRLGGRAAVVVPDNVLFDEGRGKALRQRLMSWCDLHTILRLPTGIFYAQGVKTNVLFFTRADEEAPTKDATEAVWIYDMRSDVPAYGKTNPIRPADFAEFVKAFGDDPLGRADRTDTGEQGRFRRFTRDEIAARGDNLDIHWLKDTGDEAEDGLDTPEDIAAAIEGHLKLALEEIGALVAELGGDADAPELAEAAE